MTARITFPDYSTTFPEVREVVARITASAGVHESTGAEHAERVAKVGNAKRWSASEHREADALRESKFRLLYDELDIRGEIESYFAAVKDVYQPAATKAAIDGLAAAEAKVKADLIAIGFIDGPVAELRDREGITREHVWRHPSVIAAALHRDAIQRIDVRPNRNANIAAMDKIQSTIDEAVSKATASLL